MKIVKTVLSIIMLVFLLTGCSQSFMLNEMSVVQGISLDEIGGEVTVCIQYLDLNKGSGKNEGLNSSLTSNAQGSGKTLVEAMTKLASTMPDKMYYGQTKLIIIGDAFYEKHMTELKNELLRNNNFRCDLLLSRSKEGRKVIENGFRNERVPIDGVCKELKSENALVNVNDYLGDNGIKLPRIISLNDSGYIVY